MSQYTAPRLETRSPCRRAPDTASHPAPVIPSCPDLSIIQCTGNGRGRATPCSIVSSNRRPLRSGRSAQPCLSLFRPTQLSDWRGHDSTLWAYRVCPVKLQRWNLGAHRWNGDSSVTGRRPTGLPLRPLETRLAICRYVDRSCRML